MNKDWVKGTVGRKPALLNKKTGEVLTGEKEVNSVHLSSDKDSGWIIESNHKDTVINIGKGKIEINASKIDVEGELINEN